MTSSKISVYSWVVVGMLCVVGCLNYLDRMMIATMRSSIVDSIPMSDAQFGLLTSVFLWIYGLLSPVAGYLADKFNRSRVIIISLFVWSIVTWLTSYATTFEELLLTRALMGISEACYIPAALALIMDYHRGPTRSLANGIHMAGIMIGQSIGFIGGWIADNHTWNYAFAIFGIIGVVYALLLMLGLKDPRKDNVEEGPLAKESSTQSTLGFSRSVKFLFSHADYRKSLLSWALLGIVGWMVIGWLPTYFKEKFSLTQTVAGVYATGYFHTASLIGVLTGGYLADRWSKINPRARVLLPAIGMLVAAPAILLASYTTILPLAIISFMLFAFTRVFLDANMMPILCMFIDSRFRATGYGILNFFSCMVGGVGLYAGGALRDMDINLSTMFQYASAILIICSLILFQIQKKPIVQKPQG